MEKINKSLRDSMIMICISMLFISRYTIKYGNLEKTKELVVELNLSPDIIYDSNNLQESYANYILCGGIVLIIFGLKFINGLYRKQQLKNKIEIK